MSNSESTAQPTSNDQATADPLAPRESYNGITAAELGMHVYGNGQVCETNSRGFPTPGNSSPFELVLDSSEGFIPLWSENVTLRWRFNEPSMQFFANPEAAKDEIRQLWGEALLAWGGAMPLNLKETEDVWDFEVVMSSNDKCFEDGCVMARAFFPDSGRHDLLIYPKMFSQTPKERIDTLIHEMGHVFGLRHFFADVSETAWPSEIFGEHKPFSIMNYGSQSELTDTDRDDLGLLYASVWSGDLKAVNGTGIRLFRPFHEEGASSAS